jgi:hypothetical protein
VCQQRGSVVGPTTHDDRRGNFRLIENAVFDVFPNERVARMEQSDIRVLLTTTDRACSIPDFASLNPGYLLEVTIRENAPPLPE